jgi:NADH:ubiquinone oxidoreductase subunit K
LGAKERELFIINSVIEPVMIPVIILLILVRNKRNISVTMILEVQRGKLGLFANKNTINTFNLQRLMMNGVYLDEIGSSGTHKHHLTGPHIHAKPRMALGVRW